MKTEEIAAQLRESIRSVSGLKPSGLMTEAADALDAQAAQIAELKEIYAATERDNTTKKREVEVLRNVVDHARRYALSGHHQGALRLVAEIDRALATPSTTEEASTDE